MPPTPLGTRTGKLLSMAAARAFIAASLVLLAAGGARAANFGDISVSLQPLPTWGSRENTTHGYLEYRVVVANRSATRKHQVELTIPRREYGRSGNYISRISRTVSVGPHSTVMVSLFQPALNLNGDGLAVAVDGRSYRDRSVPLPDVQHGSQGYSYWRGRSSPDGNVLVSRSLSGDFRDRVEKSSIGCCRSQLPTAAWSSNWLGYSRFDGVVVTAAEAEAMSPAVAQALRRYVECGGSLLIVGDATVPAAFRPAGAPVAEDHYVGFGRCMAMLSEGEAVGWAALEQMWARSGQPHERTMDIDDANRAFPVVENVDVPVRGMLSLMIVFALAIGPVNLWLLSRWKRRIWLLWIVPAASLLTCGGVFAYSALAEGWYGHGRTAVLTILDEQSHRATTIGWTAYYCPLTPAGGLRFSTETELTPQVEQGYSYRRQSGTSRRLDWTTDQHLTSGWVSARVPAHFKLRKSEVRRERLSVGKADDGTPTVVNGLGAAVRQLWLADEQGQIWLADNIAAGAQVPLTLMQRGKARAKPDSLRNLYARDWLSSMREIAARPADFLQPGCYIAVMDDCPFVRPGAAKLKSRKCRTVVYGIRSKSEHGS